MKKLLLIALLLPVVVMGQKMPCGKTIPVKDKILRRIDIKPFDPSLLIYSKPNASSYVLLGEHTESYTQIRGFNIPEIKPVSWIITGGNGKEAMRIILPDSSGIVKGYINKKKVIWTSDSTFTLKTRE